MSDKIFGRSWGEIQRMQQKQSTGEKVDTSRNGDYGADPMGDGTFRMMPSGDIVNLTERNRRLLK